LEESAGVGKGAFLSHRLRGGGIHSKVKMQNSKFKIEAEAARTECRALPSLEVSAVFGFFSPFLSCKGFDFSPVRAKTGNKKFGAD
jgi:hypothetical protein